jgi:hypothetical protein
MPNRSANDPITERDAYFSGLLFADGWFDVDRQRTGLQLNEPGPVEGFRRWADGNPVRRVERDNHDDGFRCRVTNQDLFRFLDHYGVVSKVQVSPPLTDNKHFWRGFIDGDGSIMIIENHGKRGTIQAVNNSPVILEQLKSFADCLSNCSVREQSGSYVLRTTSRAAEQFVVELYAGASVYLDRKIETAHKIAELNGS